MRIPIISLFVLAVAVPPSTAAPPAPCSSLTNLTNPVYLQVGDTQLNLMKSLGRALRDNTPNPVTLLFVTSGSCTNIDNMYNHSAAISTAVQYVPSTAENPSWTTAMPTLTCS